jgi:hypothetical protein
MKYHNVLYAVLSTFAISFHSFNMEVPSREDAAKQLVATREIKEEEKKKKLLEEIIKQIPYLEKENEPLIDNPEYFHDLYEGITITTNISTKTALSNRLEKDAKILINTTAANKKLTVEEKLTHIEKYLSPNILFYLQKTWENNLPKYMVTLTPKEEEKEEPLMGRVEELSSEEEEEKSILEELPTSTTIQRTLKKESPRQFARREQSPREPKKQPNIFTRTINFIWNGISSIFKWIFSWFR